MALDSRIRQFFLPSITRRFLIRILAVALTAYLIFGHLCIPFYIHGTSMEPTYHNGGVNFCWRLRYLFSAPKPGDIIAIRFAGSKVMLLKRVVAREGEWVEFRNGRLFVDSKDRDEPYIRYPSTWNLPPRQVQKNTFYVVGDNRSMPIENHHFGQVSSGRVIGGPLW